jgi:hypothetical protein
MAMQKDFLKDGPEDTTPEKRNMRLSSALAAAPYLQKGIIMIERVEEGEKGWTIYSHG